MIMVNIKLTEIILYCENCKDKFIVPFKQRNRKYCSYDCFKDIHNDVRICVYCGKSFRINKSRKTQKFCSRSCGLSISKKRNKNCVGRILSEETKKKIGKHQIGRKPTELEKIKKSISGKLMWVKHKQTGYYDKVVNEMRCGKALEMRKNASLNFKDTNIERKVENYLLFNDILYVKQYWTGCSFTDFWLPETNTIIECDGDYWHNLPGRKESDVKQTKWLEENDYIVYRFKGSEIIKNVDKCMCGVF